MGDKHPEKGSNLPKCRERLRAEPGKASYLHSAAQLLLSVGGLRVDSLKSIRQLVRTKKKYWRVSKPISDVSGHWVQAGKVGTATFREGGTPLSLEHWTGSRQLVLQIQIQASAEHRPREGCHQPVKSQRRDQLSWRNSHLFFVLTGLSRTPWQMLTTPWVVGGGGAVSLPGLPRTVCLLPLSDTSSHWFRKSGSLSSV